MVKVEGRSRLLALVARSSIIYYLLFIKEAYYKLFTKYLFLGCLGHFCFYELGAETLHACDL